MASLRRFDIGSISRKPNGINARISVAGKGVGHGLRQGGLAFCRYWGVRWHRS